jgi:tetratricopeptide (TPR) repeat protein
MFTLILILITSLAPGFAFGAIVSDPASVAKLNSQAAAYIQKLRETGDGSYLERAGKILDRVLAQESGNYEALRLRNEIALNLHQFAAVAVESRKLAAMSPKDPRNWGTLGDALMEMGDYEKAADAYQEMVNVRPGISSYNRVAFYRFVTGDADGAIAAMMNAIGSGSRIPENLAWCLVDLGWMYFKTGKIDEAGAAFGNALRVFPGYHRAYAGMGQVLAAQGLIPDAIESYRQAQGVVPLPEYAAALDEFTRAVGTKRRRKDSGPCSICSTSLARPEARPPIGIWRWFTPIRIGNWIGRCTWLRRNWAAAGTCTLTMLWHGRCTRTGGTPKPRRHL